MINRFVSRAARGVVRMALLCLGFGGTAWMAGAADGPGFPNVEYDPSRVGEILSIVNPGKAISSAVMHRGYLFVPLGADNGGGQGAGAFELYNVSNPQSPVKVFDSRQHTARYHNSATLDYVGNWAEIHHLPVSGDVMVMSERRSGSAGFSIFDLEPFYDSDTNTFPRTISRYSFPGVTSASNYDGYSFALSWQGRRYVFAPTGANGLFIVDTTDLNNPVLLAHRTRAELGNLTLRAAVPIGNLLILSTSAVESTFRAIILDISNPANPVQVGSFTGPNGYQGFVYGSAFYGGGSPIARHDFSNPANVVSTTLRTNPGFDRPEYGFGHDGYLFIGHYPGATKWQLNGNSADFVTRVDSGLVDDHAFLNPLGNLVILCSDHNNTRKLMIGIHGAERDLIPPQAMFTSPASNAVNVHQLSRVGVSFSDIIKPSSVNTNTLIVRRLGTSAAVPGTYSTMYGIVNFVPNAPLSLDTTYEVVLAAGGVEDQVGNAVPTERIVAKFSTGTTIRDYVVNIVTGPPAPVGATVNFSLTVTNLAEGTLEHAWDYGDGTPLTAYSTSTAGSHTYNAPGNFPVTVRTRFVGEVVYSAVTGVQIVHLPVASPPPLSSSTIVYDAANLRVWNVNPDNGTVTAIHATNHTKQFETTVGQDPKSLAPGPGNRLWVVNKKSATISVIDRATGGVIATYALPYASAPHGIVIDSAAARAYVSLEAFQQVVELDTATGDILRTVNAGPWPRGLALDVSRQKLWVSRFISPDESGVLGVVDLGTFSMASTTTIEPVIEPDTLTGGRGLPNYVGAPALSSDLSQAYVPAKKDNIFRGMLRDGKQLTSEHTVRSMTANIALETGVENTARRVDLDNSDLATAAAFSPLGNYVFLATSGSATIWALDAYDPMNSFTFSSGGLAPDGMAVSPDGSRLFIHNFMDRSVTVFDAGVVSGIGVGDAVPQLAKVNTVATEQLAPAVLRGKQLFYDTTDARLAQDGYMSCASCHLDGGHDGRVWDFTGFGEGLRNTIDLNGRGAGHGPAHWTANFDETQDFEGQIRDLGGGTGLMDDADFNSGTLAHPLGQSKAGFSADLDALAAYVASLTTAGKSPHRQPNGQLTPDAAAGREIFRQQNCASCHGGTAFTDSRFLARHDVGTLTAASGRRLGGELDGFDTPTLRGLWKTAPYLHDGSAPTLRDVLVTKNIGGLHGWLFSLSESEVDQLVAYLEQIDDLEISAPVSGVNQAPTLAVVPDQTTPFAQAMSLSLSASDPEGDPLTYHALGLPPGLILDSNSGVISGAPGMAGIFTVQLSVTDSVGNGHSRTITWTVSGSVTTLAGSTFNVRRYVKLVADSSVNSDPWTTIAEFNVVHTNGTLLNRSGWVVTADSQETTSENAPATRAIDGSTSTFWHTAYSPAVDPPHPHHLIVNFGSPQPVGGFTYLPRQNNVNGRIKDWRFFWSDDGTNWGSPVASGTFTNSTALQTVLIPSPTPGTISREYWTGISGNAVSALTSAAAYPNAPAGTTFPTSFEGPTNFTNNYGTRIHGYVIPPASGSYRFWIASDDNSELWLSSNHDPANQQLIASVPQWTSPLQWTKYSSQRSAAITLEAGVLYYIRALHKNGNTPDNLAVAWQGSTLLQTNVIAGQYLMPFVPVTPNRPPVFSTNTQFTVVENSVPGTQVGAVTAVDPDGNAITFAITGGNVGGAFAVHPVTGALTVQGALDYESRNRYDLVVRAEDNGSPVKAAAVAVTVLIGNELETSGEVVRVAMSQSSGVFPGHANPALIGFGADPDGDGWVNAFELLFGMNPDSPDAPGPMRILSESFLGQNYMGYEFDVSAAFADLIRFRGYGSSNLLTWAELTNAPAAMSEVGGWRTYRIREDAATEETRFRVMRLGISPSEPVP